MSKVSKITTDIQNLSDEELFALVVNLDSDYGNHCTSTLAAMKWIASHTSDEFLDAQGSIRSQRE